MVQMIITSDSVTTQEHSINDFDQGTYATTLALIGILKEYYKLNINFENNELQILQRNRVKKRPFSLFKLIFFIFILLGFFGKGSFLFLPFLFGGFGGRSYGGFGSGGGSFGGFGGGMSGGGGASGSF